MFILDYQVFHSLIIELYLTNPFSLQDTLRTKKMALYVDKLEILEIAATVIEDVDTQVKEMLEGVGELKLSGRHTGNKWGREKDRKREKEKEKGRGKSVFFFFFFLLNLSYTTTTTITTQQQQQGQESSSANPLNSSLPYVPSGCPPTPNKNKKSKKNYEVKSFSKKEDGGEWLLTLQ